MNSPDARNLRQGEFLELIREGYFLVDAQGRFRDANPAFLRQSGYALPELLERNLTELPAEDFMAEFEGRLREIGVRGSGRFEARFRRPDGTPWQAELSVVSRQSPGGPELFALVRDISARKAAERRQQRLGEFYSALGQTNQALVRMADEGSLFQEICDIAVKYTHVGVAFVARPEAGAAVRILASAGPQAGCLDQAHISVREEEEEGRGIAGTCFRSGAPAICHDVRQDPRMAPWLSLWNTYGLQSGAVFPLHRLGKIYGVLGLYTTETAYWDEDLLALLKEMAGEISFALDKLALEEKRQHAEASLQQSEERYRHMVTAASEGIWSVDADHRTSFVNPAMARMLGYTEAEMLGVPMEQFMYPEDLHEHRRRMDRRLRGEDEHYERRFRRRDGSECWCRISATPQYDLTGRFVGAFALHTDVTRQKEAEQKLRLAASVFESTQEGILITDDEGKILEVNQAFSHLTGYTREEALGQNPRMLKSGRHDREFFTQLWRSVTESGAWRGEIWNRKKSGELYPEWLTISSVRDELGRVTNYIGAFSDISLLKQHEQQLEYMAYFDALTGLPNRVLLADRMRQAMAHTLRQEHLFAVACLDLDAFKPINDQYGHDTGDRLLIEIAKRIRGALREGDTVARLGGDEFVVLLLDLEKPEECKLTLRRLLEKIAEPLALLDRSLVISASIGASLYPLDKADPDTLLRHADQAMYQAKQSGKNRFHLYDPKFEVRSREQLTLLGQLETALENREFVLYYQPRVNLHSGRVIGVEALIRWQRPIHGLTSPGDFLPLLESHPLGEKIDHWVMGEALRQMDQWNHLGLDLNVSVNITAQSLQATDFIERLKYLLLAFPAIKPGRYEFEILETAALEDIEYISRVMRACQRLGVRFALDDFGTGYSSLTYLRHLPAEILKIDQSFVRDMLDDEEDLVIVQGVIGLSRAFSRQSVAEGVETVGHGVHLLRMGCDMAQGFGIARPMPAEEVPGWAAAWKTPAEWR